MPVLIDPEPFHSFAPGSDFNAWAPALTIACVQANIDTRLRLVHFLAQLFVESQGFTVFEENLNYSAVALKALWAPHFPAPLYNEYARQPERIANRAYANRMGNGDETSGDGWLFRGRGPIQTTGRANYAAAARQLDVPDLADKPDLMFVPLNGARAAGAFWLSRSCNPRADDDDIEAVSLRVNGGLTGLDRRKAALATAKRIWLT